MPALVITTDGDVKPASVPARSRWRKRLLSFWVRWNGQQADALHMPEDAEYLNPEQPEDAEDWAGKGFNRRNEESTS